VQLRRLIEPRDNFSWEKEKIVLTHTGYGARLASLISTSALATFLFTLQHERAVTHKALRVVVFVFLIVLSLRKER
jgi:hypothetical protein